ITNKGDKPVYFELTVNTLDGRQFVMVSVRQLAAGETFHHPRDTTKDWPKERRLESIRITDNLGKDRFTVYASEREFPAARRLRGEDLTDRLVHPFYEL